jgi:hypothetical protein
MQCLFLHSAQHMLANFNPACLLTLGDALAFASFLMQPGAKSGKQSLVCLLVPACLLSVTRFVNAL